MASLKSAFLRLWPFKSDTTDSAPSQKPETRKITRALGPWESYMVTLQSILIWERPGTSALAVVGVNLLFWFVLWSEVKVYFVVSVVALCVFLHQQWVHSIWPEIRVPQPESDDSEEWTPVHPSVLSVPEISQYVEGAMRWIRDNYNWLLQLRRLQPALFCAIVTTVLSLCGVVGHLVPGAVLVYVIVMLVMTGPGIMLHILPESFYTRISKMRAALRGDNSTMETSTVSLDSDISEFLPELQTLEAQAALDVPLTSQDPPEVEEVTPREAGARGGRGRRAGGGVRHRVGRGRGSGRGQNTSASSAGFSQDESSLMFAPGLPEDFPSYDNDSVEDLDAPEIELPDLPQPQPQNRMEFVSTHFGDSSDEEEDFMEGLSFEIQGQSRLDGPQARPQQPPPTIVTSEPLVEQIMGSVLAQNAGNVLSVLGQNLMSSVIGQNTSVPPSGQPQQLEPSHMIPPARMTRSEDFTSSGELEDDFEMISDEELQ